ncbi:hypothetical protein MMC14_001425 [Varicellaria rhodocarpa]|nr:hypothetical protein [Varicellaria rhodocarpa]
MSWNSSGFIGLQPFLYLKSAYSDNTSLQSACLLALTAEAAQRNYRGEVEVLSCWYQLRSSPKTAKHGPAAVGASKQNNEESVNLVGYWLEHIGYLTAGVCVVDPEDLIAKMKYAFVLAASALLIPSAFANPEAKHGKHNDVKKIAAVQVLPQDVTGTATSSWPQPTGHHYESHKKTLDKYQKFADEASKAIGPKSHNHFSGVGLCNSKNPCMTVTNASIAHLDAADGKKVKQIGEKQIAGLLDHVTKQKHVKLEKNVHKGFLFGHEVKHDGVVAHVIAPKEQINSKELAGSLFDLWKMMATDDKPTAVRAVKAQTDGKPVELMSFCIHPEHSQKDQAENFCVGRDSPDKLPAAQKKKEKERKKKEKADKKANKAKQKTNKKVDKDKEKVHKKADKTKEQKEKDNDKKKEQKTKDDDKKDKNTSKDDKKKKEDKEKDDDKKDEKKEKDDDKRKQKEEKENDKKKEEEKKDKREAEADADPEAEAEAEADADPEAYAVYGTIGVTERPGWEPRIGRMGQSPGGHLRREAFESHYESNWGGNWNSFSPFGGSVVINNGKVQDSKAQQQNNKQQDNFFPFGPNVVINNGKVQHPKKQQQNDKQHNKPQPQRRSASHSFGHAPRPVSHQPKRPSNGAPRKSSGHGQGFKKLAPSIIENGPGYLSGGAEVLQAAQGLQSQKSPPADPNAPVQRRAASAEADSSNFIKLLDTMVKRGDISTRDIHEVRNFGGITLSRRDALAEANPKLPGVLRALGGFLRRGEISARDFKTLTARGYEFKERDLAERDISNLLARDSGYKSIIGGAGKTLSNFIKRDGTEIQARDIELAIRDRNFKSVMGKIGGVLSSFIKRDGDISTRDVHQLLVREPSFKTVMGKIGGVLGNFIKRDGTEIQARDLILIARDPAFQSGNVGELLADFVKRAEAGTFNENHARALGNKVAHAMNHYRKQGHKAHHKGHHGHNAAEKGLQAAEAAAQAAQAVVPQAPPAPDAAPAPDAGANPSVVARGEKKDDEKKDDKKKDDKKDDKKKDDKKKDEKKKDDKKKSKADKKADKKVQKKQSTLCKTGSQIPLFGPLIGSGCKAFRNLSLWE